MTRASAAAASLWMLLSAVTAAEAHRSGCHRWHSCPSDHGAYVCGDLGHCSGCPDNEYCLASLNYSRTMKDKSHRATRRCYRSGVWTLRGTQTRRLDGHSLYSASHDPIAGPALASQPTLSRFENAVGRRTLIAMGHVLADTVIEHHRRRLKGRATRITIDLDPTDDPTHGQQEFTFFNGHYDTWCYLPVVATVTFNDEAAQFAVAAVLRPGNAPASLGARGLLRRLLGKLRQAFPDAVLRVRLDGGFASAKLFAVLER